MKFEIWFILSACQVVDINYSVCKQSPVKMSALRENFETYSKLSIFQQESVFTLFGNVKGITP